MLGEVKGVAIRETLLRRPWLLPFAAALMRGASKPREVADLLGCSRRLAATGLYALRRTRDSPEGWSLCVVRWGSWFAARIGSTLVVAKVAKRRVKAYTVPLALLGSREDLPGRLGYRVRIARLVLEKGEGFAGKCG